MSFLSRLFGLGARSSDDHVPVEAPGAEPIEYKTCLIVAAPKDEGGQWRVAGAIEKQVDGTLLKRTFVRADLCMTKEEAVEVSHRKGRQIIDQNPRLFDDPEDMGPV